MKDFLRIFKVFLLFVTVFALFYLISENTFFKENKVEGLVIFGDNIQTEYTPFIENDYIYIAQDTIEKTIDEDIYFDKVASKLIVTTDLKVVKFKVKELKMSVNFEYQDIKNAVKIIDEQVYVPIEYLKDIYDIDISYNENTKTITIDERKPDLAVVEFSNTKVYSKLETNSKVLATLNKDTKIIVYNEALVHNRWKKIKTEDGIVGYISKNAIKLLQNSYNEEENIEEVAEDDEKIVMFWQYGSSLSTLGTTKEDGVNVVSPTWYELKNTKGEITSKCSSEYYGKAKSFGYEIWPIITNGFDSANYSSDVTSQMLNSEYNRENFIKSLVEIVEDNKLDGINIDFEVLKESDREVYTQLIKELTPILRNKNVKVSVDTYFVKYIDRKRVGKAADYVILMGYDQRGNWSTTSGSISEISWVEENIQSLINIDNIPSNKIILGIPFYTRLWEETQGKERPTSSIYSMKQVQNYIKSNNLTPVWDEDAGQNYVQTTKGLKTYKMWLEDQDSIKKRVETVNKYKLKGISAWQRGLETSDTWKTIKDNLEK